METAEVEIPASAVGAQVRSALRDVLKVVGAALATKGVIDESMIEPLIGAVLVLAPFIWSQVSARMKHRLIEDAAAAKPQSVVVK